MARISFTLGTIAAAAAFFGAASAQSGAWGQCGGIGWSGSTTCVSGYTCTYSNDWYSQCLPGTAGTTTTTTKTSTAAGTTTGTGPSTTTTSSTGTPQTLLPGWLWLRAVEAPNFHKYLQSVTPLTPGDAILGDYTTAGQFQITGGQLIQYLPDGTTLYGHVEQQTDSSVNKLRLTFATDPDTYGTFDFQGDGVIWTTPSIARPNTGAFLACSDPVDGSAAVYINLGNYAYMTPAGCADETINYYNAATAVPKA